MDSNIFFKFCTLDFANAQTNSQQDVKFFLIQYMPKQKV